MTLIEIVVVIAIMMVLVAIGVPTLRNVFDVDQRSAARELAQTYSLLQTEAMLRNVTFRIAYNLDRRSYKIEVADPGALIFSNPAAREEWEKERDKQINLFTKKEIEAGEVPTDPAEKKFGGLTMPGFETEVEMPSNTFFAWAWTPQYEEAVAPSKEEPEKPEDEAIVYSYVFPNGTCEYTVIRVASMDAPDEGYTLEVEPLSGKVSIESEMREIGQALSWLPSEGPEIN